MNLQLGDVAKLESDFQQLKAAYERFFLGIDRVPPEEDHESFKLALRNANNARQMGAQLKLRMQNLVASNVSYEQLWKRQLQSREQTRKLGTAPPKSIDKAPAASPAAQPKVETQSQPAQEPKAAAPAQPESAAPPPAAAPGAQAVSDANLARVWQALVAQHQKHNAPHPPAWGSWRSTILTQIETAQRISGAPQVSLQLVVEGGVPNVRVVPKK